MLYSLITWHRFHIPPLYHQWVTCQVWCQSWLPGTATPPWHLGKFLTWIKSLPCTWSAPSPTDCECFSTVKHMAAWSLWCHHLECRSWKKWPYSGLPGTAISPSCPVFLINCYCYWSIGHQIGHLQLIFRMVPTSAPFSTLANTFLTYMHCFNIFPQSQPDPTSGPQRGAFPECTSSMYVLKNATWSNGTSISGIVPLQQVHSLVNLIPQFGDKADRQLKKANSFAYSREFWLNKYFDKEFFYALDNSPWPVPYCIHISSLIVPPLQVMPCMGGSVIFFWLVLLVMCKLRLEALSLPKPGPFRPGQAKPLLWALLGFWPGFNLLQAQAQGLSLGFTFSNLCMIEGWNTIELLM